MIKTNRKLLLVYVLLYMLLPVQFSFARQGLKLWYKQPAATWVEALPVGNGKIGAMIFGGVEEELIQLNESTLYSGGPVKAGINLQAPSYLPQIRKALLEEGDFTKANDLTKKMQGLFTESYLPLGDLLIKQHFKEGKPTSYYRSLDIQQAVALTEFTINGVTYSREIFTSAPDNILVIRFTCTQPGNLNLDINTNSPLYFKKLITANNEMVVNGKAPAHINPSYYNPKGSIPINYNDTTGCNGMRFQYRIRAVAASGAIQADTSGIHIQGASEVLLYVSAATSFNGFDKCPDAQGKDEKALASGYINKAAKKPFYLLRKTHIADFQQYFDRVSFTLADTTGNNANANLPADERLKAYTAGAYDPGIETLYFQYARYLLISASRPGGPPANLQGIWNKELRAPWSSNYTININTEMNYWPAEVTNLSEMHQPLLRWIQDLSVTGTRTAKEFYGANGWVANHNSEIWATSNPVGNKGAGDPVWANWPMGAAWLCQHLWEHYAFTQNKKFLADSAYPVMKNAARFMFSWLVQDENGYLVTAPSTSPENKFKDSAGKPQGVSVATTMDMSIIWDLFTNLIEASKALNTDAAFRDTLLQKRSKLYPMRVGSKGQLLEWFKDFEETDLQHRHVSHLFGLHPGRQITPSATPDFFAAARKTLEIRGDGGTGWSRGWKINWWARLLDGNHAYRLIRQLLTYTNITSGSVTGGGTYPNFFDAHPPFQIDGNFAGAAGMAEMLLQSQGGEIQLLPALPDAWQAGSVKGLIARGNFEIAINWKKGRLVSAAIQSRKGGKCVIRTALPVEVTGQSVKCVKDSFGYTVSINTAMGKTYFLKVLNQ